MNRTARTLVLAASLPACNEVASCVPPKSPTRQLLRGVARWWVRNLPRLGTGGNEARQAECSYRLASARAKRLGNPVLAADLQRMAQAFRAARTDRRITDATSR